MTSTLTRVGYHRLTPAARETIRWTLVEAGGSIASYVRDRFPDGQWGGDTCGCTDDRCSGHHHDAHEECGCLPVLLEEHAQALIAAGARRPPS